MEKYLVSNEKNLRPIWRQIQPKCLRNYAWKMMMWHIVWSKKTGKAKLWRSICLVMKIFRTVSSDVVWPFKNRFRQNRINKNGQQPKCLRFLVRKFGKEIGKEFGKEKLVRNLVSHIAVECPLRGASRLRARIIINHA